MPDIVPEVTDTNFDAEVLQSTTPILVDFYTTWCPPCRAMMPTIEALAEEYKGKLAFRKMNLDENANTPVTYQIRSVPYFIIFKDGKVLDSLLGEQPKAKMKASIDSLLGL